MSSSNPVIDEIDEIDNSAVNEQEILTAQPKRRGRPRKIQPESSVTSTLQEGEEIKKRGRGRPKKVQPEVTEIQEPQVEKQPQQVNSVNLFELGDEDEETTDKPDESSEKEFIFANSKEISKSSLFSIVSKPIAIT